MNPVIIISAADNVATALEALDPGRVLDDAGGVTVRDAIPRGHKVALRPIPSGSSVVKYGSTIGTATADIPAGAHVHTHNVESSRGRGDIAAQAAPAPPRLAEPADDRRDG